MAFKKFAVKNIILGQFGILFIIAIGDLAYFKPDRTESSMPAAPETPYAGSQSFCRQASEQVTGHDQSLKISGDVEKSL